MSRPDSNPLEPISHRGDEHGVYESQKTANISYRTKFQKPNSGKNYDERVYALGSIAQMLWDVVERSVLLNEVARFAAAKDTVRYLDFACGTGRVLSVVEPYTTEAVGVDVSEYMLELARPKVQRAKLVCTDLSQADATNAEKFDLITAFRFLTRGEEPLRWQAVRALRERLRERDSLLIINTHGNPFSYRLIVLPYNWLRSWIYGKPLHYITTRHAKLIMEQNGLVVHKVVGMGFIPERLLPLLPRRLTLWIERTLSGVPLIQRFGVNQMFFCHVRDEGA